MHNEDTIIIDAEFKSTIPDLTAEEYLQLEENIVKEGCRDPLVVWKGYKVLLDGHNRYKICQAHNISYNTVEMEFSDRIDVKRWIIMNQIGKRNITNETRLYLIGKYYREIRHSHGGDRTGASHKSCDLKTNEIVGIQFKVHPNTVLNASTYAENIDTLGYHHGNAFKNKILHREIKITQEEVKVITSKSIDEQKAIVAEINKTSATNADSLGKIVRPSSNAGAIQIVEQQVQCSGDTKTYHVLLVNNIWNIASKALNDITLEELKALPIESLSQEDSLLFFVTPNDKISDAIKLLDAWGWHYRALVGLDNVAQEFLIIATKGNSLCSDPVEFVSTVLQTRHVDNNGRPLYVYRLIEDLCPDYSKVEVFPREKREGWDTWFTSIAEQVIQDEPNMPLISVAEFPANIPSYSFYALSSKIRSSYTHGIHRYPAKFIPDYPRWAINKYLKGNSVILDPFCGSGTTLLEGILAGNTVYGIDIDPLARLISKVKTTPLSESALIQVNNEIVDRINNSTEAIFKPTNPDIFHWFDERAIEDLSLIRTIIDAYRNNGDIYDFLLITLSSIVKECSLVDTNQLKAFVSNNVDKVPADAKVEFIKSFNKNVERFISLSNVLSSKNHKCHMFNLDARNFSEVWFDMVNVEIDLAVTSPTYINSYDYTRANKLEYIWIGDVLENRMSVDVKDIKKNLIGTEHVSADKYNHLHLTGLPSLDAHIFRIFKTDRKRSYIVFDYFDSMKRHLLEMHKVLKKTGHYIMVVGNSNILKKEIKTHKHLVDIAIESGFNLENIFASKILNKNMKFDKKGKGGEIAYEWVLDLKRV
ncbi:MAG: hypothetical protein HQL06_16200 [Nitrospirae bacterium]|nr:hypothetical protein [Nitrospirota bacterium]